MNTAAAITRHSTLTYWADAANFVLYVLRHVEPRDWPFARRCFRVADRLRAESVQKMQQLESYDK